MHRAEFGAAPPALRPLASPASNGSGGSFGSAYAQLHGEILGQIREGFGPSTTAAQAQLHAHWSGQGAFAAALPGSPAGAAADAADSGQRRDFLQRIGPWARQAAAELGVSESLVAAHAALESGWGRHSPRAADGGPSHNLFGIKSGGGWRGASTAAMTQEFLGGQMQSLPQHFRSYDGYAQAFADYAELLQNPRYAAARGHGDNAVAFAAGLVRGGYATDPGYAGKLVQVAGQVRQMLSP